MKHNDTAQDILRMPEERFVVAGARMLARAIYKIFSNDHYKDLCNAKSLRNTLAFFANNCPTDELELFLYGLDERITFEKCGKGKNEYRPVKVIKGSSSKLVNPHEFVKADEQKYRALCKFLLDALENAADMIALMSGRGCADVLEQMAQDVGKRTGRTGLKVCIEKRRNEDD